MLIAITEHNAWENERWTYILDLSKQKSAALNSLMIFVRLANDYYQQARENAPKPFSDGSIFMRHTPRIFAASHYRVEFYDSMIATEGTRTRLSVDGNDVSIITHPACGYQSAGPMPDAVISPKKALSALVHIREGNPKKKENILYKKFDSIFLSKKSTSPNASNKNKKEDRKEKVRR